jgi:hypothetical protein
LEPALPGPSADVGKAKEVERFRFAEPELGTLRRSQAAERFPATGGKPGRIPVPSSMAGANSVAFD